jgi:hypothetical protein
MRGPQHERLEDFIGRWHTQGKMTAPGQPADAIDSLDTYEWLPGKYFVLHRWDSRIGKTAAAGIEIIAVDDRAGGYRTHFFDNGGGSGSEQLTVAGQTWTWLGQDVMGTKWHRCTSTLSDDGHTMTAQHERSENGVDWEPWMEVTLRRTS